MEAFALLNYLYRIADTEILRCMQIISVGDVNTPLNLCASFISVL
jgi:hypothetical protein